MMDAREKWAQDAEPYLQELAGCAIGYQGQELVDALYKLRAHLRTTPEGFALVPVERLEQLEKFVPTVSEYIDNYLQDERDELDYCICGEEQQRRLQSVFQLRDRLESSKAPPPKSEPL